MPYRLLSDIHGNLRAFEAVLAELARFADRKQMPYAEFALVTGDAVEFRHCAY